MDVEVAVEGLAEGIVIRAGLPLLGPLEGDEGGGGRGDPVVVPAAGEREGEGQPRDEGPDRAGPFAREGRVAHPTRLGEGRAGP